MIDVTIIGPMPTIEARLRLNPRRAIDLLRQERRLRRAAKLLPRPTTWEWARPRLMPLLAPPYLGPDPIVTSIAEPGCAVIFGIELARTFVIVDRQVAERWECTSAQLEAVAAANLRRRAGALRYASVRHGVLAGRLVRILDSVPWASSLILAPAELTRLFGNQDQLFGTPRRDLLVSIPITTPIAVAAHIVVDLETNASQPLLLDPFLLEGGALLWQSFDDGDVEDGFAS
jgi:hypothetical protein